jgi:serine phosphatase RsbU (regulator of sigma subunit)
MSKLNFIHRHSEGLKYNMAILTTILLVFLAITLVQAFFTWSTINDEQKNRERMEANVNKEKREQMKKMVETVVDNSVAGFEQMLENGTEVEQLLVQMLRQNPDLLGAAVAYVPGYHHGKGKLYAPYVFRDSYNIKRKQLNYDYTNYEWFEKPMQSCQAEWSQPYTDTDGTYATMVTYSVPLRDTSGRIVAVLTGDMPVRDAGIITDTIYHESSLRSIIILCLQVAGLLLILLIVWRAVSSMRKFQNVSKENALIIDELSVATKLQHMMLPHSYPTHPKLDLCANLEQGKQVSGDFYDYLLLGNKFIFCIGDVSSHGVGACMAMSITRTACRSCMQHNDRLPETFNSMNQTLISLNERNMYATFLAGQLDLDTGILHYCNAGHLLPYLVTKKGAEQLPAKANVPLGITDWDFEEQQVQLQAGDTLFIFTDGIIEALNEQRAAFTEKKLALHLKNAGEDGDRPQALINRINIALRHHLGIDHKSDDDLTMMAVTYLG